MLARRFVFRILAAAAFITMPFAAEAQLSQVEFQYVQAIRTGDVGKARALRQLANINPNQVGGRTLIAYVPEFPGSFLFLKPAAYDYVVGELKQDLNTPIPRYDRTIFASFCYSLSEFGELHLGKNEEFWQQSITRINDALDRGAHATPLPSIPPHSEPAQPLPMCVKAYLTVRHIPKRAEDMLNIIQRLIKAGANPNASAFGVILLARAVEDLDVPLLNVLVENGANINANFPARIETICSLPKHVTNTVLAYMPDPDKKDIPRVAAFLKAFQNLGGNVIAPRHSSRYSAGDCITTAKTLKQRALDLGQVEYAVLVSDFEVSHRDRPQKPAASQRSTAGASAAATTLRATASLNTRQSPSATAPLARKLNPGDTLTLEGAARDGWSAAKLADGSSVWVNLAALQNNTAADTATAATSAPSVSQRDSEAAHLEAVALILQGSTDIEPRTITDLTRNSFGIPAWERRRTTTIITETPCSFRVISETTQRDFDQQTGAWGAWKAPFSSPPEPPRRTEYRIDFTKAVAIKIERMEDPEEGLMRSLVNQPGSHHPPMMSRVSFRGAGTVCRLQKMRDGTDAPCSTDENSGAFRDTREAASMVKRAQAAFAKVKARCPNTTP